MKISFLKRMEFCIVAWLILYDASSNKIKQQFEEEFLISKLELLRLERIGPCNFLPSLNGQKVT